MTCASSARKAGFTLIETMVAIVLLMIVLSAVYGSFQAASMSVTRAEERADVYQTARILLAQITSELSSAFQPGGLDGSSLTGENAFGSDAGLQYDKLTFVTTAHRSMVSSGPAGDVCKVTYTVESTPDGHPLGLFLGEDFSIGLDTTGGTTMKLSELVVGLNCRYLDSDDEWQDEWIDRSDLPGAVRVELAIKPEREGAKPVTVAATANLKAVTGNRDHVVDQREEVASEE